MTDAPRLARSAPPPRRGMVHLGPGAFFRAFNAVFTDEAMTAAGGDWGITAVSLKSPAARDLLAPQGGLYTSVTLAQDAPPPRVIGALREVLVAPEDPGAVLAAMADPAVCIVSLTVTEKGYGHAPATGRLDRDNPDIAHDLAQPEAPRSAPGYLVAALARRRAAGTPPFTVLSCDNLPANGALVRGVVLDLARARDPGLADWIAEEARFPATMVDRITPATTPEDVARLAETCGYHDPACVVHEAFRQWVIEDDFVSGRPAWEAGGAQFVTDVSAHETMKLRCLNGTHSTLAYLGYLAGYETVADTVADPDFAALCHRLWRDEILPTVPPPEGEDLPAYCNSLLARYRDPSIRHRTWQIATDGSRKLPQRLFGTIRDARAAGGLPQGLCLAVAGWMRYVCGTDEQGAPIDVRDPLAERLRVLAAGKDPAETVTALMSVEAVFGTDLPGDTDLCAAIVHAYARLLTEGARATVARFVAS